MEPKFQIGDVVTLKHPMYLGTDSNIAFYDGIRGTICDLREYGERVGVQWEFNEPHGHSCDGHCPDGYGWYVYAKCLELADLPNIVNESDMLNILAI